MEEDEGSDSGVGGLQKNKNNVIESSDEESDGSESDGKTGVQTWSNTSKTSIFHIIEFRSK